MRNKKIMRLPKLLLTGTFLFNISQSLFAQSLQSNGNGTAYVDGHLAATAQSGEFVQLWRDNAIIWKNGTTSQGLRFGSATNLMAGSWTERMRLMDNGNLGIGTTSPVATLHVVANNQSVGDDAVIFDKSRTPASHGNRFSFVNVGGLTSEMPGPFWRGFHLASPYPVVNGSPTFPRIAIYAEYDSYNDPTVKKWVFHAGNSSVALHDIQFKTEDVELMYMKSNGNIGIGTTNPQAKLAVKGDVFAQKVKVTLSGWSDYVFNASYRLLPLSEVEAYIKQYGHLPEVVSAEEVEKNGLDVGDNQATLLKKIEELTLYVIEQNKQIKKLETENREMNALKKEMEEIKATIAEMRK